MQFKYLGRVLWILAGSILFGIGLIFRANASTGGTEGDKWSWDLS